MDFANLITDEDKHKLLELSVKLKKEEEFTKEYKNHLSNLWRITQKAHKKTEDRIKNLDEIIALIRGVLGEK